MAKVYYDRIVNHKINPKTGEEWTINDVPETNGWREQVREMLENEEA